MFVRNPNSNYTVETDEELSYVPLNTYTFDNTEDEDIYVHNNEDDERYLPPFLNNPLTDILFGPQSGPGGPPGGPGGPGGGPNGGPPGPPPSMTPSKSGSSFQSQGLFGGPQTKAVSPGSIRPCRYQFVYIWLTNGRSFWAWLTYVDRRTASGFRWNGRRWVYFGIDLRRIDYFECYGRNNLRDSDDSKDYDNYDDYEDLRNIQGPPGAPPSMTPAKPTTFGAQTFAVSPESLRRCRFQFVYIWLRNGRSFWAWLIDVDRRTATGFRWTGRTWTFFGVSLQSIEFFQCFGRSSEGSRNIPGPPGPPPSMTPAKPATFSAQTFAVSPESLRRCRFEFVYIWLRSGTSFWAWLLDVDSRTATGFRWTGRRWTYFGVSLQSIEFFQCFGRDCVEDSERGLGNPFNMFFGPPSGGPSGGNSPSGNQGSPPGPPPSMTPSKSSSQSLMGGPQVKAVSPGSIKPCLYQFVYIWLTNGRSFWAWLTRVDKESASGFRWTGFNWAYFGVDLKRIDYFECYGRKPAGQRGDIKKNTLPNVTTMSDIGPLTNGNTGTMGNLANMQDLANMDSNVDIINMDTITDDSDVLDMTDTTDTSNAPITTDTNSMNGAPTTNGAPITNDVPAANGTTNLESNIQNQTVAPTEFKVDYPVITDLPNEEAQGKINDTIISEVTSLLNNQVIVPEQKEIDEVALSYQIPLKESGLLCIVFSIYIHVVGTPGNTIFSSCTFDTNTGEKFELDDLFIPNSNYKEVLSNIAMEKCEEDEVPFITDYEGVTDSQQFYLTPNGLVLYYQPHEYTPSSYGLFRIPISYDELVDVLSAFTQVSNFVNHNSQV